jgi:inorganic pyrophosphatase
LLPPWADETTLTVIETPKGSRNKFTFDPKRGVRSNESPARGMTFPYDFGFVPSTLAGDGDPIDVLVLMDQIRLSGLRARLQADRRHRRRKV